MTHPELAEYRRRLDEEALECTLENLEAPHEGKIVVSRDVFETLEFYTKAGKQIDIRSLR